MLGRYLLAQAWRLANSLLQGAAPCRKNLRLARDARTDREVDFAAGYQVGLDEK
jgi:hypothetical protein